MPLRVDNSRRDQKVTGRGPRRAAFTVIELLVVMAVIALLLSLLVVAVNAATRTGQSANTRHLLASIHQGLVRFRQDIGYLPPVLGHQPNSGLVTTPGNHGLRKLFDPRGQVNPSWGSGVNDDVTPDQPDGNGAFHTNTNYPTNIQDWYSETSLAEYLVGYGNHHQDGYGVLAPSNPTDFWTKERPPLGIRHPDTDGVWGATVYGAEYGSLASRMQYPGGSSNAAANVDSGPVFGPYLELKDERLLASATIDSAGKLVLSFPGAGDYNDLNPKVIVDYWGNPIRYYRRLYSPGALASDYRPSAAGVTPPTLADIFLLRPFKLSPGSAIDGIPDLSSPPIGPDTSTTAALRSAEFALFSAGPDRFFNPDMRYDDPSDQHNMTTRKTSFANEDNIVELGP